MGIKAGIDLGTTNSCIYVLIGDERVLVRDRFKQPTVPSAVWQKGGDSKIGRAAKALVGQLPAPIIEIKRLMGTDATVSLDGKPATPVEVSAMILRFLKDSAEAFVRENHKDRFEPITDAVITVPVRFNVAAIAATEEAGRLAGFAAVSLLQEPVAAALAYAYRQRHSGAQTVNRNILAYDLGGGTFDVTVLERRAEDNEIVVLDSGGDPHLGGANFDLALAQHLQRHLAAQGFALADLDARDPQQDAIVWILKTLAETIKINLTTADPVDLAKPAAFQDKAGEPVDVNITVGLGDFNALTKHLMDQTMRHTKRILAKQGFTDGQRLDDRQVEALADEALDGRARLNAQHCDVIMVGSSCWMPVVKERLEHELGVAAQLISPDIIVAEGAAIQAGARRTDVETLRTDHPGVVVLLSRLERTDRQLRVPVRIEAQGPAAGWVVALVDVETGEAVTKRLDQRQDVLFQPNLRPGANEFNLLVHDAAGTDMLEHGFSIIHDTERETPDVGRHALAIPIFIETTSSFATLFAEKAELPAKGEILLRTPDESGSLRIPFYEGEAYIDEITINGAPPRPNVVFRVLAEIDRNYRVAAKAIVDGIDTPPTLEFAIPKRSIRSIDEIQEDIEKLRMQFHNRLAMLTKKDRELRLRRRERELKELIDGELQSLRPNLAHLEELCARLTKLVKEVSQVPQLRPPLTELRNEMHARRTHAPPGGIEQLDYLLKEAEKIWDNPDDSEWQGIVRQCRHLVVDWHPRPPPDDGKTPPPPSPAAVKATDLAWLGGAEKQVRAWADEYASQRHELLGEIAATRKQLEHAAEHEIIEIHNSAVVPLFMRINDGPVDTGPKELRPPKAF